LNYCTKKSPYIELESYYDRDYENHIIELPDVTESLSSNNDLKIYRISYVKWLEEKLNEKTK
jgi:hypothetical protein